MILDEPYNAWLVKNVGDNIDENTRFLVKVSAVTATGTVPISIDLDLVWFILLKSQDDAKIKLDVVLALLKKPGYLAQFKATFSIRDAKRLLAEYLLFNLSILEGLRSYIDFSLLTVPIDFISHTLFIKRSFDVDTKAVDQERLKIVQIVLDSGFKLAADIPPKSVGAAIHTILLMNVDTPKFPLVRRLLAIGFKLFSDNLVNNNEVATMLIDARADNDALAIITTNAEYFKTLVFTVAGTNGSNLADYYYWVKEDMKAVSFIRSTLGLEITP